MLEHAHVFGNFYGSPAGPVRDSINYARAGCVCLMWIGRVRCRSGTQIWASMRCRFSSCRRRFRELRRRLEGRGQDSEDVIAKRMLKSWDEISHWGYYDYVLVNDDLDATEEKLKTIVSAERMRRIQQPSTAEIMFASCKTNSRGLS